MIKRSNNLEEERADKLAKVSARIEKARKNRATELRLSDQNLAELPESIGHLTQLRDLDLTVNKLTALPESVSQLIQLRRLFLGHNSLTTLPKTIGQLIQLRDLYLHKNRLMGLPESIGHLTQLQAMTLEGNQLTPLPESIGQLTQLQHLHLNNNQLIALPESIGQLTQLQHLGLNGNQLTALPETLRNLKSLERLYLHGNDRLGLPAEVLGPTWQDVNDRKATPAKPVEILEYYFRVRGGKRPLNEAKLILVGRGAVGKTSIVNQLVHGLFKDEKKTEGIKITGWNIQLHTNEDVRLNIWDFGGQEIMHATHQFFFHAAQPLPAGAEWTRRRRRCGCRILAQANRKLWR